MFDAKRLLGQVIASQIGGSRAGGGAFGSGHGGQGFGGGGALAGGLASLLLGSKSGRNMGGSATKLGGLALVGSLAYDAFRKYQAGATANLTGGPAAGGVSSGGGFAQTSGQDFAGAHIGGGQPSTPWSAAPPPAGTPFNPHEDAEQQQLARSLLGAMIAAAKADGQIDATEQANIFGALDRYELNEEDKAFVLDAMRAPPDVDTVARFARNPEEAAEIYAASLLAIDVDTPAERGYLGLLASRLKLDPTLVSQLHRTIEEAGRTPDVIAPRG
jgi:uncharacterized membrane protein YebE (DUF533 family)